MSRSDAVQLVKSATKMTVQTGPYRGVRLVDRHSWGHGWDIAPQLLGVYEQDLHPHIERLITRGYNTVINIGCAEGLYAVGLAKRMPDCQVLAYDPSPLAREICLQNAVLNGVRDRLTADEPLSPEQYANVVSNAVSVLAVVDCEGFERTLFSNDELVRALVTSDIIIETHDYLDGTITPNIISQLGSTHIIKIIYDGGRNPNDFPYLANLSDEDRWLVICENRPRLQHWLVCEATKRST